MCWIKRKDKCENCRTETDLVVCREKVSVLNNEVSTLKSDYLALEYEKEQTLELLSIAKTSKDALHAELEPLRVYQVGTAEEKLLAILENIAPTPELWYHLQKLLNNRFKSDVCIVSVDLDAYREWYGPNVLTHLVKHPGYISKQMEDGEYRTAKTKADAIKAVKSLWVAYLRYVPEHWDCDDFARCLRVLLNLIYGIGMCAYIETEWKQNNQWYAHAINGIWTPEGGLKVEPQTKTLWNWDDKYLHSMYQSKNMRCHIN